MLSRRLLWELRDIESDWEGSFNWFCGVTGKSVFPFEVKFKWGDNVFFSELDDPTEEADWFGCDLLGIDDLEEGGE